MNKNENNYKMISKKLKMFLIISVIILLHSSLNAQENEKRKAGELISKLEWLSGSYRGEKWGSIAEEYWSKPLGNNMIGMFRLLKDGEIVFTELVYIIEENDSLILKLKHFSPEFVGWEEKDKTVDFPVIEIKENEVVFDGMTYKKREDGILISVVKIMDKKSGEIKEEEFTYQPIE